MVKHGLQGARRRGTLVTRSSNLYIAGSDILAGDPAPDHGSNTKWVRIGHDPNALTAVATNATLTGSGTASSNLAIANSGVGTTQIANGAVTPVKLSSSAGTAGNTTYYRGDGRWATPPDTGLVSVHTVDPVSGDGTAGSGVTIADGAIDPVKLASSSGTAGATTYYRGDGTWSTPPSSMGGGISSVETEAPVSGDGTSGDAITIADGAIAPVKLEGTGDPGATTFYRGDGAWATISEASDSTFDIHDDVGTAASPAGADRFVFSDESETGDPTRYVTGTDLRTFIVPDGSITPVKLSTASQSRILPAPTSSSSDAGRATVLNADGTAYVLGGLFLTESDVDARILPQARTGSTAAWPDAKIPVTVARTTALSDFRTSTQITTEINSAVENQVDYHGDWVAASAYDADDVVRHAGAGSRATYLATQSVTANTAAVTEPGVGSQWEDYWDRLGYEDGPPNSLVSATRAGDQLTFGRESGLNPLSITLPGAAGTATRVERITFGAVLGGTGTATAAPIATDPITVRVGGGTPEYISNVSTNEFDFAEGVYLLNFRGTGLLSGAGNLRFQVFDGTNELATTSTIDSDDAVTLDVASPAVLYLTSDTTVSVRVLRTNGAVAVNWYMDVVRWGGEAVGYLDPEELGITTFNTTGSAQNIALVNNANTPLIVPASGYIVATVNVAALDMVGSVVWMRAQDLRNADADSTITAGFFTNNSQELMFRVGEGVSASNGNTIIIEHVKIGIGGATLSRGAAVKEGYLVGRVTSTLNQTPGLTAGTNPIAVPPPVWGTATTQFARSRDWPVIPLVSVGDDGDFITGLDTTENTIDLPEGVYELDVTVDNIWMGSYSQQSDGELPSTANAPNANQRLSLQCIAEADLSGTWTEIGRTGAAYVRETQFADDTHSTTFPSARRTAAASNPGYDYEAGLTTQKSYDGRRTGVGQELYGRISVPDTHDGIRFRMIRGNSFLDSNVVINDAGYPTGQYSSFNDGYIPWGYFCDVPRIGMTPFRAGASNIGPTGVNPTISNFEITSGDLSPAAGDIQGDVYGYSLSIGQPDHVSLARIVGYVGSTYSNSHTLLKTVNDYASETGTFSISQSTTLTAGQRYGLRLEVYGLGQTVADTPVAYHEIGIVARAPASEVHFGRILSAESQGDIVFATDDFSTAGAAAGNYTITGLTNDGHEYRLYWAVPSAATQPTMWTLGGQSVNYNVGSAVTRIINSVSYSIYMTMVQTPMTT